MGHAILGMPHLRRSPDVQAAAGRLELRVRSRAHDRLALGRAPGWALPARGRGFGTFRHLVARYQHPERAAWVWRSLPVSALARGEVDVAGLVLAGPGYEERRVEELLHLPG